jgi:hypothetical protein
MGMLAVGAQHVDARYQWWADPTGPSGFGPGFGQPIVWVLAADVEYIPWLWAWHATCPLNDVDGDGVCGDVDNCPVFNPDQLDSEQPPDGLGDVCDPDTMNSSAVSGSDGSISLTNESGAVTFVGSTAYPYQTVTIMEDATGVGTIEVTSRGKNRVQDKFDILSSGLLTGTVTKVIDFPAPGNSQAQLDGLAVKKRPNLAISHTVVGTQPATEPYTQATISFDLLDDATFTVLVPADSDCDGVFDQFDINDDGDFDDFGELDNCPYVYNVDQADNLPAGGDGIGDVCQQDYDGDGHNDNADNCPDTYNPDQLDSDGDLTGDECDLCEDDPADACAGGDTVIGPDGGSVTNGAETASVDIPPAALAVDTTISVIGETDTSNYAIGRTPDNLEVGYIYTFQPEGITFDGNVTITLTYEQGQMPECKGVETNLDIYYYDAETGWIPQNAEQDCPTNTLTLQVDHFSAYVVMAIRDSDNDGVVNTEDDCPDTPAGAIVGSNGCQYPVALASGDSYLAPVGSAFAFDGTDSYDPDGSIASYDWNFDDGSGASGVTANHSYDSAGLYNVALTVTDSTGNQDDTTLLVVVYDPAAGFATGGGRLIPGGPTSDVGDDLPGIDNASPASFGFVVKYKTGASSPDGQLEFQYRQGDFNLHSSGMEWLVITNDNWAKFMGSATIKGVEGDFPFRVDARDGDFGGRDDTDKFIIKVYEASTDPDAPDNDPIYKASGELIGGKIVIHAKK